MFFMLAALALAKALNATLEPSEPWNLSSQDDGCTVARAFNAERPVQIGFQATMQSRPSSLLVRGPSKLLPDGIGEILLTLDGAESVVVHYGAFETDQSGIRLLKLFPSQGIIGKIANSSVIAIGNKLPPLHIQGAGEAIKAVDRCTSDQLASWGVDPDLYLQGRMATITGNFAAMFDARNYPKEARGTGASGRVTLLLKTDKEGAITECKAVASPDERLDAGTCEVARRGRLKVAVDPAGQPVASFAVIPVRWARP